ncbi:MAG: MoxR family ATPase [Verrucomicrobiota bacterium]
MIPPSVIDEAGIIDRFRERFGSFGAQMAGVIVGLEDVIEQIVISILCGGHCILEGVPGLAKTKLISTLSGLMTLDFRRIQFTPDLMPGDITGSDVLQEDQTTGKRVFHFLPGPLFANIVLADEINRTPPKTQSALLEAMEERQLTVGGRTYALPSPFFVLATQNPIEQEGTYPLPEAQLDRFMLKIQLGYPGEAEEIEVAKRATTGYVFETRPVLSGEDLLELRQAVRGVPAGEQVYQFAAGLARATRPGAEEASAFVRENVAWGAGPRATICLMLSAKARAVLRGRYHVTTEDVAAMALPVLRHRLRLTFTAESAGLTPDAVILELLKSLSVRGVRSGRK